MSDDYCPRCHREAAECVGHMKRRVVQRELPMPELAAVEIHRINQRQRYESKINARKRKRANKRRSRS